MGPGLSGLMRCGLSVELGEHRHDRGDCDADRPVSVRSPVAEPPSRSQAACANMSKGSPAILCAKLRDLLVFPPWRGASVAVRVVNAPLQKPPQRSF